MKTYLDALKDYFELLEPLCQTEEQKYALTQLTTMAIYSQDCYHTNKPFDKTFLQLVKDKTHIGIDCEMDHIAYNFLMNNQSL